MVKKFAKFHCIQQNEPITLETHYEFLYHLQSALLLALRERGTLSPMEHRHGEEKLRQQRRERGKRKQEKA